MYSRFAALVSGADVADYVREFFHPECEYHPVEESEPVCGHDEMIRWNSRWFEVWDTFASEPGEAIPVGERLVTEVHIEGRGSGSGLEVDERFFHVFEFRDGTILRMHEYETREAALDAARQAIALVDSPVVSFIRESYEAMNEGRFDWLLDNVPPNFELIVVDAGLSGPYVGPAGMAKWYAELAEVWETFRIDVEDVVDLGDRVVVLGRIRNKGRVSGIEVDVVAAHLWTIEDGVPVRIELIGDREEALRRGRAESSGR